jgi:aryl-alcohol dehydrogenase-like predicted oxidoreductase
MRFASNMGKTIEERVRLLDPYPVDLYQVHQPFGLSSVESEMRAMTELYNRNLIKAVGVSNFNSEQMRRAFNTLKQAGIPLASNQMRYSLLDRRIESNGVMDIAKELGITIIAYSPLAQGIVTGKFHDNPTLLKNIGFRKYSPGFKPAGLEKSRPVVLLLKELALKYNVTTSQIALNWLINYHGDTVVVIPGATKETHVKENTGAMSFRLSDEDMVRIDRESAKFK